MHGYMLILADPRSNVKRGGVVCQKPSSLETVSHKLLQECITFQLSTKNKLCIIATLYGSPSQSHNEFTNFTARVELMLPTIASKNISFV